MVSKVNLRIHHFYDIIRDLGSGKKSWKNSYNNSLDEVARLIISDTKLKIKLVLSCDSICDGCIHNKNGHCDDKITHRKYFTSKELFNNFIDEKILKYCELKIGDIYTPGELCNKAKKYLENIEKIYFGNDPKNTKERKENFVKGLKLILKDFTIK